jgi:predicted regulator of Ras-like GTPase activity (Roadblock/LC7/MglB family)
MLSLPQLIEEDIQLLDSALGDLITKSESTAALIIDKGGPLIIQKGDAERFDTTTMAALAAGSYAATQAIAGLVGELDFSSIYQQGQNFSVLVNNIDDQLLLIVIFRANISVGAIKYYANTTITQVAEQIARARLRDPDTNMDLVSMNLLDTADVFRRPEASE